MGEVVNVLDHGYVKLIETWGSDARIIESARMSTDKGFLGWEPEFAYQCVNKDCPASYSCVVEHKIDIACPNCQVTLSANKAKTHPGDTKLLKFLWDNKHFTPFEFCGLTIEVQAPLMVFREWQRHRTQSYNELSARYTPMPDVNYLPTVDRCLMVSGTNKQAGKAAGAKELTHDDVLKWLTILESSYQSAQAAYEFGLEVGIPKELARLSVPVGRYSRMRATANLRNWFQFMSLRLPENAQWEIRQYAQLVANIITKEFPRSAALFKS